MSWRHLNVNVFFVFQTATARTRIPLRTFGRWGTPTITHPTWTAITSCSTENSSQHLFISMGSTWTMRSTEHVKIMWRFVYDAVIVTFRH